MNLLTCLLLSVFGNSAKKILWKFIHRSKHVSDFVKLIRWTGPIGQIAEIKKSMRYLFIHARSLPRSQGSLLPDFGGGITWFLGEQKGALVVTENPKGGITENFGRIQRGAVKFAWKMKTWGGSRKSSKVIRGDHFSEVTLKGGRDRLNFTLFSPKSSPPGDN